MEFVGEIRRVELQWGFGVNYKHSATIPGFANTSIPARFANTKGTPASTLVRKRSVPSHSYAIDLGYLSSKSNEKVHTTTNPDVWHNPTDTCEANMPDIIQQFSVKAPLERVFQAFATPDGLEQWWTKKSSGESREGESIRLYFGPEFDWHAKVSRNTPPVAFEIQITQAHPDWEGTRVGCELAVTGDGVTSVRFYHTGWPENNEHWRVSCYCWAMYLRILRRNLEYGETVEYEKRLEV